MFGSLWWAAHTVIRVPYTLLLVVVLLKMYSNWPTFAGLFPKQTISGKATSKGEDGASGWQLIAKLLAALGHWGGGSVSNSHSWGWAFFEDAANSGTAWPQQLHCFQGCVPLLEANILCGWPQGRKHEEGWGGGIQRHLGFGVYLILAWLAWHL